MKARHALAAAVPLLTGCSAPPTAEITRPPEPEVKQAAENLTSTSEAPTTTEAPETTTSTVVTVILPTIPPTTLAPITVSAVAPPAPVTTWPLEEEDDDQWWKGQPGYDGRVPNDVWWQLALCESTGTNANTGNGYYGFFQWSLSTWRGMGESGYPTDYGYDYQRAASERLQARYGWGQWPECSRRLGLR